MDEITRNSFDNADSNTKLGILFDISHNTRVEVQAIKERLGKKTVMDKLYIGVCGFLGGLTAMCLRWFKII